MGKALDLRGQKFGRLIAIEPTEKRSNDGSIIWRCFCDCGNECFAASPSLRRGDTKSCGCLKKERARTHYGMRNTPAYKAWKNMIQRCENPNNSRYKDWGGRGISVSEEFHDFQTWYDHIGPKPGTEYSQDRINNDGNYERGNIRWATREEQANNSRPISRGPYKQFWFRAWHKDMMCQFMSNNQKAFARKHNLISQAISACLRKKLKQHKGWTFQRI